MSNRSATSIAYSCTLRNTPARLKVAERAEPGEKAMSPTKRPRRKASQVVRPPMGQRIYEKRTELGFSQEYIAEMIGAPQSWTTKVERGEIKFGDPARMRALAQLLRLDYDELLLLSGIVDRREGARKFADLLPPPEQARLEALHQQLDPLLIRLDGEDIQTIKRLTETLARARDTRLSADPTDSPAQQDPSSPETPGTPNGATSPTPDVCGR
jgi:transcriptional regulator with XRE-family HTH domain